MKFVIGFIVAVGFVGCAHTRHFTCPDGSSVWIEPSESQNKYLAYSSEQARGLAACAKEDVQEASETAVNQAFED